MVVFKLGGWRGRDHQHFPPLFFSKKQVEEKKKPLKKI
jgi:hypothetical protein